MQLLDAYLQQHKPFKTSVRNAVPGAGIAFFIGAALHENKDQNTLIVAPDDLDARRLTEDLQFFSINAQYLPSRQVVPYELVRMSRDLESERLRVIASVSGAARKRDRFVIVTTPESILERYVRASDSKKVLTVAIEDRVDLDEFGRNLVALGYQRVERVEVPGEFARKAGIIDVFPTNRQEPIRLDFFDDEIETIRMFDPENQIGSGKIESAEIFPAAEITLGLEESRELVNKLKGLIKDESHAPPWMNEYQGGVITSTDCEALYDFAHLVRPTISIYELLKSPSLICVDPERIDSRLDSFSEEILECHVRAAEHRFTAEPDQLYVLRESAYAEFKNINEIAPDEGSDESGIRGIDGVKGRVAQVQKQIVEMANAGAKILITSKQGEQLSRVKSLFNTEDLIVETVDQLSDFKIHASARKTKVRITMLSAPFEHGFRIPSLDVQILTDNDLFGRSYKKRGFFKKRKSSPIESFLDLKEKDIVVHVNHGIGRFLSLERVNAAGRERDFLVLEYADDDRLYVPLDQIANVQRYSAPSENPRLDSLGKASFKKTRERVEKRAEELAEELVKIYSARMNTPGFAFPKDTIWQDEFESAFEWEETPDQLTAIEAVKNDMESPRPMDRLVCGDVGYGKTEVAIRATFKCVMAGRQVALVCPTTVLALQHFKTFTKRFKDYPIRVDWISRFRTPKEIAEAKSKLAAGELDVIIGTHAILASDLKFKSLGLLVIDEEQRFGVSHKEALKKMKMLVDVLTLSATPIPRTLHMSLAGIRDLSIIQTPPRNRMPVMTHVTQSADDLFKEAIELEIKRGGQVFYLHNRVDSIERAAAHVRSTVKNVSVGVLHGQMEDDAIEDILLDFIDGAYQVLVTTSIIENGIDMPNVNTLIVDDADYFGLSQLYQLRGRVGRSDRQAFAYFFYKNKHILTETAQKRLNTIMEYQELGSGFKVAMRDLEIRGAGNILGKEQSGDIMDVGFEMYLKLLEEAVARIKGEEHKIEVHCVVNLNQDQYLPEDYMPDTRQRIEFYKRFESSDSEEEIEQLEAELRDRFGEMPLKVRLFAEAERIRLLGSRAGFEQIYQEDTGRVQLKASKNFKASPEKLMQLLGARLGFSIQPGMPNVLFFKGELTALADGLRKL